MMYEKLKARLRLNWNRHFKLRHRKRGYRLLPGVGAEIGAFYLPACVPRSCKVIYCDTVTKSQALNKFPELKAYPLVEIDKLIDLDKSGLLGFMNHVIEHVANPIKVLEEMFRVVKSGGYVVITAPDKDYSIDRPRSLTNF